MEKSKPHDHRLVPAWWRSTGLKLGVERYERYLLLFRLSTDSFFGAAVGDIICGPFGGMLSVVKSARATYPLDFYGQTYSRWRRSPVKLIWPKAIRNRIRQNIFPIPDNCCDMVFCLDAIEHTPYHYQRALLREASRITRPGGHLFLFTHTREEGMRPGWHTLRWLSEQLGQVPHTRPLKCAGKSQLHWCWQWNWVKHGRDKVNEDPWAWAIWGVLTRTVEPVPVHYQAAYEKIKPAYLWRGHGAAG